MEFIGHPVFVCDSCGIYYILAFLTTANDHEERNKKHRVRNVIYINIHCCYCDYYFILWIVIKGEMKYCTIIITFSWRLLRKCVYKNLQTLCVKSRAETQARPPTWRIDKSIYSSLSPSYMIFLLYVLCFIAFIYFFIWIISANEIGGYTNLIHHWYSRIHDMLLLYPGRIRG